ncbi:hypothetical protein AVEN_58332-1 [Araneus ventricosus]|uniref:Uncharacterized protein n=1 Tax=Araneus ventricosus TaxID=182803 RepID=A0A4Y2CRS3_ARAVE|nr:hypothetical protein AVEN_58332-1 [Araneus ventricosus]
MFGALSRGPGSCHIIGLRESFWTLNRDSSVKSTRPHCSGVQLRCSWAQCNRAVTCTLGTKAHKQQIAVRTVLLHAVCATLFGGIWAFLQQQRAATPFVALFLSSVVWHIATGSGRLPLW